MSPPPRVALAKRRRRRRMPAGRQGGRPREGGVRTGRDVQGMQTDRQTDRQTARDRPGAPDTAVGLVWGCRCRTTTGRWIQRGQRRRSRPRGSMRLPSSPSHTRVSTAEAAPHTFQYPACRVTGKSRADDARSLSICLPACPSARPSGWLAGSVTVRHVWPSHGQVRGGLSESSRAAPAGAAVHRYPGDQQPRGDGQPREAEAG
eukprot:COSAG02_NODE_6825_length_3341_cov_1.921653_2_plen_204_part_00